MPDSWPDGLAPHRITFLAMGLTTRSQRGRLPDPEGPSRAVILPAGISREMSSAATKLPFLVVYTFLMFSTCNTRKILLSVARAESCSKQIPDRCAQVKCVCFLGWQALLVGVQQSHPDA